MVPRMSSLTHHTIYFACHSEIICHVCLMYIKVRGIQRYQKKPVITGVVLILKLSTLRVPELFPLNATHLFTKALSPECWCHCFPDLFGMTHQLTTTMTE